MLVLSRHVNERIIIGDGIAVVVVDIRGDKVRLGIEAPRDVSVHREEVKKAIDRGVDKATAKAARVAKAIEAERVKAATLAGYIQERA